MLKTFVEEAAALASITLFVGMIAVWSPAPSPALKTPVGLRPRRAGRCQKPRAGISRTAVGNAPSA